MKKFKEFIKEEKEYVPFKNEKPTDEVRCNQCEWSGTEDDLERGTDEEGAFDGCPNCKTDSYLMKSEMSRGTEATTNESSSSMRRLKGGEIIEALDDIRGVSNSYNTPERIDIKKGALLRVPSRATRMGDVFCDLVDGDIVKHRRYLHGDDPGPEAYDAQNYGSKVGLSEGYDMGGGPWALGSVDTNLWLFHDENFNESVTVNENKDEILNMTDYIKYAFAGDKLDGFLDTLEYEKLVYLHNWVRKWNR